jgi:hypothetical protein
VLIVTPYRAKFKEDVWKLHPRIVDLPFGCACEFQPLGKRLKKRQKKFGKKTAEGIFMGFKLTPDWPGEKDTWSWTHVRSRTHQQM